MKKLILLIVLIFGISNIGFGQQRVVKKHFSVNKNEKVVLHLKYGRSITVKSWPKNEVAFKATIEINQGKLNDALELQFEHQNGRLRITSDYNKEKLKTGHDLDCPGNDYSKYSISDNGESYTVCADITYKVTVPSHVDLNIKSITGNIKLYHLKGSLRAQTVSGCIMMNHLSGPVRVKSVNGDITMNHVAGPIRANSVSGFVDLTWSSEKPAQFNMKTVSGQVYTNLDDLNISNRSSNSHVGHNIKATLGEGGPTVSLKSVSGSIYLREAEDGRRQT